jgi:hypothetical protein
MQMGHFSSDIICVAMSFERAPSAQVKLVSVASNLLLLMKLLYAWTLLLSDVCGRRWTSILTVTFELEWRIKQMW